MFFHYRQNNSYGKYIENDSVCINVFIEADDSVEADIHAQSLGIYFGGVAKNIDCSCCGDRWDRQYTDGTNEPCVWNSTSAPASSWDWGKWADGDKPQAYIYYVSGAKETIWP